MWGRHNCPWWLPIRLKKWRLISVRLDHDKVFVLPRNFGSNFASLLINKLLIIALSVLELIQIHSELGNFYFLSPNSQWPQQSSRLQDVMARDINRLFLSSLWCWCESFVLTIFLTPRLQFRSFLFSVWVLTLLQTLAVRIFSKLWKRKKIQFGWHEIEIQNCSVSIIHCISQQLVTSWLAQHNTNCLN